MKRVIVILLVLAIGLFFILQEKKFTYGPGEVAPGSPVQNALLNVQPIKMNSYEIQPLARFEMEARVLSTKKYYFGHEARLSPLDVVFGWGPMSDESNLDNISILQRNRWYYWSSDDLAIPKSKIELNSANMHLIPSNREIRRKMKKIRVGHVVELRGDLVRVTAKDGWRWKSSLSRTDTGKGACELIWVKSLSFKSPE